LASSPALPRNLHKSGLYIDAAYIRALFNTAREEDYDLLAKDARTLADRLRRNPIPDTMAEAKAQLARLKARADQVLAIDFFGRRLP
jgi:hypothetical protein